jgi:hypothetical protein
MLKTTDAMPHMEGLGRLQRGHLARRQHEHDGQAAMPHLAGDLDRLCSDTHDNDPQQCQQHHTSSSAAAALARQEQRARATHQGAHWA